tara:strand:- start:64 stop:978 length:915 start_codon:yes stop_codon:yes gene_type:complete
MKLNYKLRDKIFFVFIFVALVYTADYAQNKSTLFMPKEYKTVKKLVNQIASKNDLGAKEIRFSINNGAFMSWRAKSLDLCKDDTCWYFSNLNPYKRYKNINGININDLANQSYLYGGLEAYAWKDVVWLSRSTFRSYGTNKDFLACTIAHEIAHIIYDDHIPQSIKLTEKLKSLEAVETKLLNKNKKKEENKEEENKEENLLKMELSRETEKETDKNASKMIINAGFANDSCLKNLTFITKFEKLETETDKESTHPGYLERYESLRNFNEQYNKKENLKGFKSYEWKWQYRRKLNSLIFIPQKK